MRFRRFFRDERFIGGGFSVDGARFLRKNRIKVDDFQFRRFFRDVRVIGGGLNVGANRVLREKRIKIDDFRFRRFFRDVRVIGGGFCVGGNRFLRENRIKIDDFRFRRFFRDDRFIGGGFSVGGNRFLREKRIKIDDFRRRRFFRDVRVIGGGFGVGGARVVQEKRIKTVFFRRDKIRRRGDLLFDAVRLAKGSFNDRFVFVDFLALDDGDALGSAVCPDANVVFRRSPNKKRNRCRRQTDDKNIHKCRYVKPMHFLFLFDATDAKPQNLHLNIILNGSISARRNSQRAVIITNNGYSAN